MKTLYPLVLTEDISKASEFYRSLFGFEQSADIGWYVQLALPLNESAQLALMDITHSSVPVAFRTPPAGVLITIEFDEVDPLYARATELGAPIHVELVDEEWGQRHFMTEDPTGLLVDVVKSIPPSAAFLAEHGLGGGE